MRDSDGSRTFGGAAIRLRVDLLGFPTMQVDGADLILSDQKAQALLAYLAASGEARTRDHLATLLWSESPESNARHSLRSSLYHLRHALGGATEALQVSRTLVSLRLDEGACDVARFRRLIATHSERQLAEAVSLYRGPLLEGLSLADAPVFEDWLRAERANLSHAYLHALERLAAWAEARGALDEAIDYVRRMVQVDALNEAAQQRLMRLHLENGAAVLALRQYQRFEAELRRELGLTPSAETQELFQRALQPRRGAVSVGAAPALEPPNAGPGRDGDESAAPFVGRDDLLAQLLTIGEGVREGRGATVLLHGETGMGKTRLLGELAARLAAQSSAWSTLIGSCSPFDDLLAYGPFYEALQSAELGDLTELLTVDQGSARAEEGAVMWRVLQALRLLSRGGPALLAIDDLHWANSSTLQLFGFLVTHLRNLPVLLVGTVEHVDALPAVRRLLTLGRSRGEVHVASVTPLTPEAVTTLLSARGLSLDAAGSLAAWLQTRSGGSPYLIGEMLAQLRADDILTASDSGWRLDEGRWLRQRATLALPETTYDLIAWRLASLSPEALHLLDVLAVAGQPLPFALLHDFPDVRGERSLQLVDDLLAKGLLVEAPGEALSLPHHLLAEARLSRMSQLRRRAIHRQLLDAIERCPALRVRFPLRQMALHAVAAEDVDRARRYGLQALDELLLDAPSAETLGFAQRLYDLLAPSAKSDERLRLIRALGQLHQALGQLSAALRYRHEQLRIAADGGDLAAQANTHFDIGELALVTSDYAAAVAAAEAGLALTTSQVEASLVALASRGYRLLGAALAMEGSDLPAADRYLQQAAAGRRSVGGADDLCAVLFELGNVAAQRGDLARALACYEDAGRTAEAEHAYYYRALAYNNFAYHSLLLGRGPAADEAAIAGLRVAETHELVGALLHLYSTLGEIRLYQAEWRRAVEWFERGLTLAEDLGSLERRAGHLAGLGLAARGEGDLQRATSLFEEALALIPGQGHWHLRTRIQLWLAETWLLRDQRAEAGPYLQAAYSTALTQERSLLLIQSERVYACLLAADGEWNVADALFARSLERAADLGLALEAARTRAAWGDAQLRFPAATRSARSGRDLLMAARRSFTAHDARADLRALSGALQHGYAH